MNRNFSIGMIIMIAAILRVWGIGFAPNLHADEPIIVNHAMAFGTGDLNPHFFKIPPLVSYLVFALYAAGYAFLKLMGNIGSPQEFAGLFFSNPEPFYVVARLVFGALIGTATVGWVYIEARKIFSERAAQIAALCLAVNFLHVRDSHFIYVDIPMVLAVCLAYSAARRVHETGTLRSYLVSGALIGLAAALKYNAAMVCVAVFSAHCMQDKKDNARILMAAALSVIVFVFLNPFILADWAFFWNEMHSQAGAEGRIGLRHVLGYSLWNGVGVGVLLLSGIGALQLIRERTRPAIVMMAFPLTYLITLVFFSQPHERYVLPLIPFICLLAGFASDRLLALSLPRLVKVALFFGILLALLVPSYKCTKVSRLLERPDTRQMMKEWIEVNVPAGSSIAFDHSAFRPRLARSKGQWDAQLSREDISAAIHTKLTLESQVAKEPSYQLYFMNGSDRHDFSSVWPIVAYDEDELQKSGIQYVVLHAERNDPNETFKEHFKKNAKLVATFSPFESASRRYASDPHAITCAPYTWEDIRQRKRLGPLLELYALKG